MTKTPPHHLLTTGEAAAALSVTPDTVLKWIKSGKLPAQRTAGGHHRIEAAEVERLSKTGPPAREEEESPAPLRCWEYFSKDGVVREQCLECVAYLVRAAHCFHFEKVEPAQPGWKLLCSASCAECPYYQRTHGLPARVLAITADAALAESLNTMELDGVLVRTASDAYTASAEIGGFHPSIVLLDAALPPELLSTLREQIMADRRIPWVTLRVIGTGTEGGPQGVDDVTAMPRNDIGRHLACMIASGAVEQIEVGESTKRRLSLT